MNSLLKSFPFAAIITLAVATTASAIQPDADTSVKLTESQSLIAQSKPATTRLNQTRSRRLIDQMLMLHLQMVAAAEEAMQSPDPEIRKMAQETMKNSNAAIDRMLEMRRKMYRYLDEGIGDDAT